MSPTPEMIEAVMNLTLSSVDLPASECLHERDVREIQAAALALIPGDPVAWQWRQTYAGRWGNWNDCGLSSTDVQKWLDLAKELPNEVQVRPLYATSAPLPVAVKALEWDDGNADTPFGSYTVADYGFDDEPEWRWTFHCYPYGDPDETKHATEEAAKAAAQQDYEARIRSALSSPVGGMGERAPIRISAHEYAMEYEFRADEGDYVPTDGERAMIEDAINGFLSENEISPVPASDIAALREENENFRRSLAMIANTPAWGAPDKWETTPAEVRQLARNAIAKTGSQS